MGLPFTDEPLSLLDGEVFTSHKKKHEEMLSKRKEYPFMCYTLKSKSKKSNVCTLELKNSLQNVYYSVPN